MCQRYLSLNNTMKNKAKKNNHKLLEFFKPWISSLLLLPVIIYYLFNSGKFTFIDYINLLIHEGGHGIFRLFGKFVYTLGGTITQILIPSMFVIYYMLSKKKFLTQLFMVWLGENLLNISVYAADAQSQKLPLIGGRKVYHDWTYLLSKLGILNYDYAIGEIFYWSGVIIFIIALLMPLIMRDYSDKILSASDRNTQF